MTNRIRYRSAVARAVSLALAGLAFVVTLIIGRPIVTFLRLRKAAKQVRIDGPGGSDSFPRRTVQRVSRVSESVAPEPREIV